ncbi:MAG TPA: PilZ domain-containing protein [Candidatus Polarisedimenticolaceae bacterium]|nr:PilZ domain-containing protein [Candidatus Polarisedimenticolaceae bacterium]
MQRSWCPACSTNHDGLAGCPGELTPVGVERPGWRITVETPHGLEAYGVLVAQCEGLWRARVVTFPNVLWKAPGLAGSMKFVGGTGRQAMDRAIEFVRRHCTERGYRIRGDRFLEPERQLAGRSAVVVPAPRKVRFLPLRFGVVRPSEPAGTANLSESGIYIITPAPLDPGRSLTMSVWIPSNLRVGLSGRVVWMTKMPRFGRPPGMGVCLAEPPPSYLGYVRALP